ncbi:MAG: O-antigen polysaccharide polymerase Wzy family protein [Oscillibacter sp.]|nr:O-antigen polysaccharide polymerase Wzy family protein [Oscillibacter sp.]
MIIKLFFSSYCIVSLLMLWYSPHVYSRNYCWWNLAIFCLYAIPYLKYKIKKNGFFNFDTLFLFSFFCINYLHAIFIYPYDSFLPAFTFPYNPNVITYALSLASVGISFYLAGNIIFSLRKTEVFKVNALKENLVLLTEKISLICSSLIFLYVLFFISDGLVHLYPRLMVLMLSVITLAFYYRALYYDSRKGTKSLKAFLRVNKLNLISLLIFVCAQFMIGSRGEVIFVLFSVLFIINTYYSKLKTKYLILLFVVGIALMCILMLTRTTKINLNNSSFFEVVTTGIDILAKNEQIMWVFFLDFIVNARTLYESIDYVSMNDLLLGVSYIPYIFCFLPGGGIMMTNLLLGKQITDIASGYILTDFANAPYGLGTNMIADLYINFSFGGVAFGMFLLGLLVSRVENCNSKYRIFAYCSLMANCIYIPRASIFAFLDMFVMLIYLDLLLRFLTKKKLVLQRS